MGEDNASWFPLKLIRWKKGIFYYKRSKFRVTEKKGRGGDSGWTVGQSSIKRLGLISQGN